MLANKSKLAAVVMAMLGMTNAIYYAQFCNDDNCSVGCGESVSAYNPGCLNESGRHSIKFHGVQGESLALIYSPSPNCPCQNNCKAVTGATCMSIPNSKAQSYRFIEGSCPANNC